MRQKDDKNSTGKVIQRLFNIIYIHTQQYIAIGQANGKSSTFTIKFTIIYYFWSNQKPQEIDVQ